MPSTREIHGLVITDHEFAIPLDHSRSDGETITVFAREVAAEDGRERPFLVFLQGGPGSRGAAADDAEHSLVAAARAEGLPSAAARPARHRPLDAGRRAARVEPRAAGRVPEAAPRRRDRPRRGVDPAGARRRALEHPRAELRRLLRLHVPLVRARRAARGVLHRRPAADRPADRRRLPRDVRARSRAQPALLRALPGRPRARARAALAPRERGGAAAVGRPPHARGASASSARCSA